MVEGPDPLGASAQRPWVKLSDSGHPFDGEEGVYAAVTSTRRAIAVELQRTDFDEGGLRPGPSFVSPWVLVSFKHDDVHREVGVLTDTIVDEVAEKSAWYLGVNR